MTAVCDVPLSPLLLLLLLLLRRSGNQAGAVLFDARTRMHFTQKKTHSDIPASVENAVKNPQIRA